MFLPIGDTQVEGGFKPYIAYGLILMNVMIFIFEASLGPVECGLFLNEYGTIPAEITRGIDMHTLVSSLFFMVDGCT